MMWNSEIIWQLHKITRGFWPHSHTWFPFFSCRCGQTPLNQWGSWSAPMVWMTPARRWPWKFGIPSFENPPAMRAGPVWLPLPGQQQRPCEVPWQTCGYPWFYESNSWFPFQKNPHEVPLNCHIKPIEPPLPMAVVTDDLLSEALLLRGLGSLGSFFCRWTCGMHSSPPWTSSLS